MERKPAGKIIEFQPIRGCPDPQDHPPQPASGKRKWAGNPPTRHSVLTMHKIWVHKVARFYRMDPQAVEEQIIEAIQERRAA